MPLRLSSHSSTPQSHFHAVTHVTCFFPLALMEIGKSYTVFSLLLWRMQPWQPSPKVPDAKVNKQVENPEPGTLNMTSLACYGRSLTCKRCTAHSSQIVRSWQFPSSPVVWAPRKPHCTAKKKKRKEKKQQGAKADTRGNAPSVSILILFARYWVLEPSPYPRDRQTVAIMPGWGHHRCWLPKTNHLPDRCKM